MESVSGTGTDGQAENPSRPEKEKLVNREYKRRELQSFARAAGIKANMRNDELYEELLAWLNRELESANYREKTLELTPIMPQETGSSVNAFRNENLRLTILDDEERVKTPVIHVPPKNDEPDVPYIQFAGKVATMVSPSLPQSRFHDHLKEAGMPVPMVSEMQPLLEHGHALEDKTANDSLFHVLDISDESVRTPSMHQVHPANESSMVSQNYDDSVANRTTESLRKPNFNFSGMQTETMSWQASLEDTSALATEKERQMARERQYESLRRVIVDEFDTIRKNLRRAFNEHTHKFRRLAQVSLITVPPHLRTVSLQALLDGDLSQPKTVINDSLIETLSKLKNIAVQ